MTVARELARLTEFKVFHNHLSWNAVTAVFSWRSASFTRIMDTFRQSVFREAAQADISLIFTYVYTAASLNFLEGYFEQVEGNGGEVCLVRLFAPREILEQQVVNESRVREGKIVTVAQLDEYFELRTDVRTAVVPTRPSLELGTSALSPEDSARRIVDHYGL